MAGAQTKKMCPSSSGGNNFWPSAYSARTKLIYILAVTACAEVTQDPKLSVKIGDQMRGGATKAIERYNTQVAAVDLITGEIKQKIIIPYPNYSGALATEGGLVFTGFTDGTLMAFDDTTLQQLWRINVGVGFNAPPMTFEVNGKQYVAILSGLSRIAANKNVGIPELKDQRNQMMLWVFGL
jgi:alcohol dehydrogenase (cytochrome c)